MGFGGPTIQGGMTQEQYMQLQQEQREYEAEQEELRRQQALADEAARKEAEELEAEKLKQEELDALAELEDAENEILAEIGAQDEAQGLSIDFFGSLAQGVSGSTTPTNQNPVNFGGSSNSPSLGA